MKTRINPLVKIVATLSLAGITFTQAADQYWNPSPLSGDWANSVWSATSGGGSLTTWTAANNAIFDQAGPYTATINAAQTATNLNIKAGTVTFAGSNVLSATSITIDSGATLAGVADRYFKTGTTSVTVNGTLDMTAGGAVSGRLIQLGGSGTVIGAFRHSGTASFGGNIQDVSPASRAAILWNNGTGGTFTLSGNNSSMTGDVLMSVASSVIKLSSANALSPTSFLRLEGAANSTLVELAFGDLTRTWATGSAATAAGGINWSGTNAGFYATGGDRNLTFVTTTGGATPASVVWGSNGLTSSTVVLGAAAGTNKLTWTNDISLNAAVRTFNTGNGSATVDAALSGVLSGTGASGITKSGAGTLQISNDNTFAGAVAFNSAANTNTGWLRLSHNNALGLDATSKTINIAASTGTAVGGIELIGGITVNNKNLQIGGRTPDATDRSVLRNVSGNNAWNGNITINSAGGSYFISSQAGQLTLGGSMSNQVASSTRGFTLIGAGNFLLSGAVTDGTGTTALSMAGTGTATLTGNTNTYSGGTTVSSGTLLANNSTGSATGSGAVNVTGTVLGSIVATLGGTGTISGATTIGALGKLSPTAQASGSKLSLGSTLAFDAGGTSIFNWDLSAANTPDPGVVSNNGNYGQVAVTGAVTNTAIFNLSLLGGTGKTTSYADAFWNTNKSWNNVFASSVTDLTTLFTSFTGTGLTPSGFGGSAIATATGEGYFGFTSTTLTWTAVPEPTSALAGILLGAGLLRRRR